MPKKAVEPGLLPGLRQRVKTNAEFERTAHAGMRIKEILEQWPAESTKARLSVADSRSHSAAAELLENMDASEAVALLRVGEASPLLQNVLADWIADGCKRPKHRSRNSLAERERYERAREALSLYEGYLAAAPKQRTRTKNGGTKAHTTPAELAFEKAVSQTAKAHAIQAARGDAKEQKRPESRISQELKNDLRQLIEGRWRRRRFQREPTEQ